jgi:formate hydrogenlyase subunit 3/multisubunit Na+/H+ antiporter MnhD subunit
MLLNAAELAAVGLVWSKGGAEAAQAARSYLLALLPAILLTTIGLSLIGLGEQHPPAPFDKIAVCLLVIGFALKLGLVPVYFWLPAVARCSPAMTTALIVAIVDMGSFSELHTLRGEAPWIFEAYHAVWLAMAMLSLLGGALLALAQKELKLLLAFSSIDDMGYLLLGLLAGGVSGMSGAWLGAISHSLCKLLLFGAVGVAEWSIGKPVTLDTRGLASRVPVAAAAFMAGALGFIGVPPALGFIGHWRLYVAGAELGGPVLLALMYVASALSLLCYVRAIHRTWLGPAETTEAGPATPWPAAAVLVVLVASTVVLGFAPSVLKGEPAQASVAVEWRVK